MKVRVSVQWTETALEALRALPKQVQRGLLEKADELAACDDPREASKPLTGPLRGYYRITYARYRAIYRVDVEKNARGDMLLQLQVLFVAAGQRKERDRHDIYEIATKLLKLVITPSESPPATESKKTKKKKGSK